MIQKIVKCPNCKKFAITNANVSFKCIHCNKTFDITKMKIYLSTDSPQVAIQTLQKIKQEEYLQKYGDEKINEFF